MSYTPGDFIFHHEYGVGQIVEIIDNPSQDVYILFRERPLITLTTFQAERSSQRISPMGFRALGYVDPAQAAKLILEKPVEVIIHTLEDFSGYRAKTEDFKSYLGPYIPDWEAWWEKTQPLLKEDKRIDSTHSKLREYGMARQVQSRAEEGYFSFRFAKQRSAEPAALAELARSALVENLKGEQLLSEHREELLQFLKNVVYFNRYDLSLRLGTLFRLKEDHLIDFEDERNLLVKLLALEIRLYKLEPYTARRVVDQLLNAPLGEREIEILATGMCASDSLLRLLENWAIRRSNPGVIARFLVTALSENLPPELEENDYRALKTRLEACLRLLKSLPGNSQPWKELLLGFEKLATSLALTSDLSSIRFVFPSFLELADEFDKRLPSTLPDGVQTPVDILSMPTHPIRFVLAVMDSTRNANNITLTERIEQRLLEKADQRQDDFLSAFLLGKYESPKAQASKIISLIQQYNSSYITERGGSLICEIARQAPEDQLTDLIPVLDQLRNLTMVSSWKVSLESLREKAYLAMFLGKTRGGYQDEAVANAVHHYFDLQTTSLKKEIAESENKVNGLQGNVRSLQSLLDEKEVVLRELRGSTGGDTEEARFEERIRILKDLVGSIAEFERFLANQSNPSRDVEAVVKRITSILGHYKVLPTEAIGSQVSFNPQKHRLVDTLEIHTGDQVLILERGYLIRDHKDKLRLLKPALVKKL